MSNINDGLIISKKTYIKAISTSTIGNMLEWFDFAIYGYMVPFISPLFFPSDNKFVSQLAGFSVFAIGYLARPLGAIILGRVGDKLGRKYLLVLSIILIGVSSSAIGLLPTYNTIGVFAPILLVFCRLLQGLSIGGEYTGAMTYTSELSHKNNRGFISSFSSAGCVGGILFASAVVWILNTILGNEIMISWGWRIPFVLSLFVAVFGYFLSHGIPETASIHSKENSVEYVDIGLKSALRKHWNVLLRIILITTGSNIVFYYLCVFVMNIASESLPHVQVEGMNTIALLISVPCTLFGGWISDKYGRRRVSLILNITIAILSVPFLYMCMNLKTWPINIGMSPQYCFLIGQILLTIPVGIIIGIQGAMISELLPKNVRCTIFSIGYSLAMGVFVGTSLMVAEWMYNITNWTYGPAIYSISWTLLAIWSIYKSPETVGKEIN